MLDLHEKPGSAGVYSILPYFSKYHWALEPTNSVAYLKTSSRPEKVTNDCLGCLEKPAFYVKHIIGDDGKENMSAPLAAEYYDAKSES